MASKHRITRLALRPLRRPALWLLVWTQRHTIALWWRSIAAELQRGGRIDMSRMRLLVSALMRVARDPRLVNAPQLRSLAVDEDRLIASADGHWHDRQLLETILGGVAHVNRVDFIDTAAAAA